MDPLLDPMNIVGGTDPFVASPEMVRTDSPSSISSKNSAMDAESSGSGGSVEPLGSPRHCRTRARKDKRLHSLQKLFQDLPDNDGVVDEYLCAWHREILIQGRVYATLHHLCFYSNILGWENRLKVKWTDIKALKKGNTMAVIPNAIQVFTSDGNSFTFTSFLLRNRAFKCFSWLWQNAVSAKPQELGKVMELANDKWSNVIINSSGIHVGTLRKSGWNAAHFSNRNDAFDPSDAPSDPHSPQPLGDEHTGTEDSATDGAASDGPLDVSDEPDSVSISGTASADASAAAPDNGVSNSTSADDAGPPAALQGLSASTPLPHDFGQELWSDNPGDVLHDETYDLDLDAVFKHLFQETSPDSWLLKVFARQKTTDADISEWKQGDTCLERSLSYQLSIDYPIGPKSTRCFESQYQREYIPSERAILECHTKTPNVPYGKNYSVTSTYYLVSKGQRPTRVRVMGELSIHGAYMARPFITWGCKKGLKEFWESASATMTDVLGAPLSSAGASAAAAATASATTSTPPDMASTVDPSAPGDATPTQERVSPQSSQGRDVSNNGGDGATANRKHAEDARPVETRSGKKYRHRYRHKSVSHGSSGRIADVDTGSSDPHGNGVAPLTSDDMDALHLKTAEQLQHEASELERVTASLVRRTVSGTGYTKPSLNSSLIATFIDRDLSWWQTSCIASWLALVVCVLYIMYMQWQLSWALIAPRVPIDEGSGCEAVYPEGGPAIDAHRAALERIARFAKQALSDRSGV